MDKALRQSPTASEARKCMVRDEILMKIMIQSHKLSVGSDFVLSISTSSGPAAPFYTHDGVLVRCQCRHACHTPRIDPNADGRSSLNRL